MESTQPNEASSSTPLSRRAALLALGVVAAAPAAGAASLLPSWVDLPEPRLGGDVETILEGSRLQPDGSVLVFGHVRVWKPEAWLTHSTLKVDGRPRAGFAVELPKLGEWEPVSFQLPAGARSLDWYLTTVAAGGDPSAADRATLLRSFDERIERT
ncbi:MAG: hypothetical protein AAFU73_23960 [Planctomycetota bacterium]